MAAVAVAADLRLDFALAAWNVKHCTGCDDSASSTIEHRMAASTEVAVMVVGVGSSVLAGVGVDPC